MQLSREQLRTLQMALHSEMENNFNLSGKAIDEGDWGYLEYKRKQRLEIKELLEAIRIELKK